ncbi:UNVERIFIED_CONTAM: hypothetical protein FKN15_035787 [Acipenser sinensis]
MLDASALGARTSTLDAWALDAWRIDARCLDARCFGARRSALRRSTVSALRRYGALCSASALGASASALEDSVLDARRFGARCTHLDARRLGARRLAHRRSMLRRSTLSALALDTRRSVHTPRRSAHAPRHSTLRRLTLGASTPRRSVHAPRRFDARCTHLEQSCPGSTVASPARQNCQRVSPMRTVWRAWDQSMPHLPYQTHRFAHCALIFNRVLFARGRGKQYPRALPSLQLANAPQTVDVPMSGLIARLFGPEAPPLAENIPVGHGLAPCHPLGAHTSTLDARCTHLDARRSAHAPRRSTLRRLTLGASTPRRSVHAPRRFDARCTHLEQSCPGSTVASPARQNCQRVSPMRTVWRAWDQSMPRLPWQTDRFAHCALIFNRVLFARG